jgi:hypothetical protein
MVTVRTVESLLVLSSIEVAGTNLCRTAVINSASGKIAVVQHVNVHVILTFEHDAVCLS